VWQEFINVLESFSYKDSLFILATKKGKKISELILPSDLILLAYMGLLKGSKSDPIIFRVYLYYLGLIVSRHHISPHKSPLGFILV